jgi:hypothetical protein
MTELNLLLEEFPDEAGSRTLQALREQLEKELAAQAASRNGHSDPHAATPSGPRAASAAAAPRKDDYVCPKHAPCRSFRGMPFSPIVVSR